MKNINYETIVIIARRIADEYYNLTTLHQIQLEKDYNIDCGTDYARYILEEIIYDKDGASIY